MCICLRKVFKTSLWSNLPWTWSLLSSFLLKSGYISIYSFQVTSNLFHVELSNWFAFLTYPSYHSLHISFLVDVTFVHEKGSYFSTICWIGLNFNVALLRLSVIRYKSFNLLLWITFGLIIHVYVNTVMHILHTVLHWFLLVQTKRICLTIKSM